MKFIKIINREYNMVELPCGKITNSIDINKLDMNNEKYVEFGGYIYTAS